jgi:redox-sensitive bicupin YhaK (pirin superfamily)
MTAGKGIVHSERTPPHLRHTSKSMHGLQIWVALPKHLEEMDPEFFHIEQQHIPSWSEGDLHYKLVAGEAFGKKSPLPVYSRLFMIEVKSNSVQTINLSNTLYGESGVYILAGSITSEGHVYGPKQILVAHDLSLCEFTMAAGTCIYIFGGEPFPEERLIYWNFVASRQELIDKAKHDWLEQKFGTIAGETSYVPLPEERKK